MTFTATIKRTDVLDVQDLLWELSGYLAMYAKNPNLHQMRKDYFAKKAVECEEKANSLSLLFSSKQTT